MGHLVHKSVCQLLPLGGASPTEPQILLVESNASRILHSSQVVFGNKHLVILTPRVVKLIPIVVEIQAGLSPLCHVLNGQCISQLTSAEHAEWNLDILCPALPSAELYARVWACNDGG